MLIITHKVKLNGTKTKGTYAYSVYMSDGTHILHFYPKAETEYVTMADLVGGENTLGSRFAIDGNSGKYERLEYFGTDDNIDNQISELREFADKCLNVPVHYHVPDTEWIYLYNE